MKQLLYWVTQENLIEFLVQSSLPYILLLMVHAHYCAPYPNDHVYDMRPTYVVHVVWHHFIPELSTPFSQVSWSVLWLCHQLMTDVTVWLINPNLSCSKNRKIKEKRKKNKITWKEKIKNKVHRQWSWHSFSLFLLLYNQQNILALLVIWLLCNIG